MGAKDKARTADTLDITYNEEYRMFNWTEQKCLSCKEKFLMSICEKEQFGQGWCEKCINPMVQHIRAKIVMGFYDMGSITVETANKLVDSEMKKMERRRHRRIYFNQQ